MFEIFNYGTTFKPAYSTMVLYTRPFAFGFNKVLMTD